MKKIAITGTIGSGKSACSSILKDLGYPVFDCDQVLKELMEEEAELIQQLHHHFPTAFEKGHLIRAKLAALIFQNDQQRHLLESITHPALLKQMNQVMQTRQEPYFFAEVPTLFESGWEVYFDGVLLISTDDEVRKARLKTHRQMSEAEISRRGAVQLDDAKKRTLATWIIENNEDLESLKQKIIVWLDQISLQKG